MTVISERNQVKKPEYKMKGTFSKTKQKHPSFKVFIFDFFYIFFSSVALHAQRTVRIIRDREPRTSTSTFTQLLSSEHKCFVQCCFTSTETIRTISCFTFHRDYKDY